ncbi:alpha/beta fold hydrolase [Thalassospira lucentensis]|uniref:alpha/beta fold hydrolase n=1 Tax=Thalassospira lucentensis TaxID=168935 RepID=UPI0020CA8326|nr:alpha/beta hydrolase [Thalassospira lucentensis]
MTTKISGFDLAGGGQADGDLAIMPMPVVFLPGMLADQRMWQPTLDALVVSSTGGADTNAVPVPPIEPIFFALSDHDSVGEMAQTVLDHAPDHFALVGMSMGGYVAFEILRRAPERVSHLMLVNTRATADSPKIQRRRMLLAHLVAGSIPFKGVNDAMLDELLHPDNRHDAVLIALLTDMAETGGADVFKRQSKAVAERPDSMAVLADITVPCSVMVGEADGVISPHSHREMADAIKDASFTIVPGAGHYVPLETPNAFAKGLIALLAR